MDGRERKTEGGYANSWFTRGSYWVGEKGGQTGYPKHRIVHRSRSRWHVTWMHNAIPIPFALILSVHVYLDFTLVCVLQKNAAATGRYCRVGTTTTDAITVVVAATTTTIAIRGWQAQTSTDISSFFYVFSVNSCCALVPVSTRPFVRYLTWFFNLVFYCYLVFLSVCSFLPMGLLSRERKNEMFEAQANRILMIGPLSYLSSFV